MNNQETKTRTFVAVNLPEHIKEKLSQIIEKTKKKYSQEDIKWVDSQNFHLTLHFLGYLTEKEINLVKDILEQETKNKQLKIILKIKEKNAFPNLKRARVLFFQCEEAQGDLKKIQAQIGQELKKNNFKIDNRFWQIHLTFARARTPFSCSEDFKKNDSDSLDFKVNSIDLMKSELRRNGPIYTILKKYPL